jgi:hypothetical protein
MTTTYPPKILNDLCIISREGVCLLSMQRVADKAKELGLSSLVELIERDLKENKIITGEYYPAIKNLLGAS